MRSYAARRLLLILPTLVLILLLVFAVVNLVPAPPPDADLESSSAASRDAYRVFREQYSLDLPVFLNLRHRLTRADVSRLLDRAFDRGEPEARDRLEDLGDHAIPALIEIAEDAATPLARRATILELLPTLARRTVPVGLPAEERRALAEENAAVERLRPASKPAGTDVEALSASWRSWLGERGDRFERAGAGTLRRVFLETRFARYLSTVCRLDFGISMIDRQPVLPTLLRRLKNSCGLMLLAILVTYAIAVPLGAVLARVRGTRGERLSTFGLYALYSLPTFFVASFLHRYLTLGDPFDWFPIGGLHSSDYDSRSTFGRALDLLHHAALPVLCLSLGSIAVLARFTRASTLDALSSDYIRTARAKGLSEPAVLFRHGLRNALLPLVTLLGEVLPAVFGGSVIVEFLFDLPGVGSYTFEAIIRYDYNAILAVTLVSAVLTLIGYLVSDLLYAAVDPRVSVAGGQR